MKNKVINLFNNKIVVENDGVMYSGLINEFLAPFEDDFPDDFYVEDIFEFAISTWNLANISTILPAKEFKNIISSASDANPDSVLAKKMIAYKLSHFKEYDRFISDFKIAEIDGKPMVSVITETKEAYLDNLQDNFSDDLSEADFTDNYINRYAIVLKPKQPLFDWVNNLYPDDEKIVEVLRSNVYLKNEDDDLEKWLQKKYDKLFMMELDSWHTNKKEWPQKRNYKMFKQWFQVDISDMVYDLENTPVRKEY
ncbi:hypothetical protein [Mariniflexile sp.]|uniref:hypothetical protein n=1 Tax=Mariniflexile sp. TaxID=1979402 RepID=UPI0040478C09